MKIEVRNGRAVLFGREHGAAPAPDGMYDRIGDEWAEKYRGLDRQIAHLKEVRPRLEAMAPREREAAT